MSILMSINEMNLNKMFYFVEILFSTQKILSPNQTKITKRANLFGGTFRMPEESYRRMNSRIHKEALKIRKNFDLTPIYGDLSKREKRSAATAKNESKTKFNPKSLFSKNSFS